MKIIEFKNVSFRYNDEKILDDVTFAINSGDFICITGANGTGKSTLLKLILNLLPLQSGEILIEGISSKDKKRYGISYVSQRATGFNQDFPATVEEIVSLGVYPLRQKNKKEAVFKALDEVNMLSYKNKLIGKLSGGQQQRVFIAKALVSEPRIILMDEPTVGVDTTMVGSICCTLGELNRKSGLTVVMVTHDMSSISDHATKIINFDGVGKVSVSIL